jgi:hypothetical protein
MSKKSRIGDPPAGWIFDYQNLLNDKVWRDWSLEPVDGDTHEAIRSNGETKGGERLRNDKIVYMDFKTAVRWHIYRAVARGEDLSAYQYPEAGSDAEEIEGDEPKALEYKLTFDTTQTAGTDLFMLGLIPHRFGDAATETEERTQSADNVIVLCLAKLAETVAVIRDALPDLEEHIEELMDVGIGLDLPGCGGAKYRVDLHVAADLKALWLALNLPSFVCIKCVAQGREQMGSIHVDHEQRELSDVLGIPSDKVHLCALHAYLRVVERLVKNSLTFAYGQRDKNRRITLAKAHMVKCLRRKKFTVIGKMADITETVDLMEDDSIFFDKSSGMGKNVQSITQRRIYIRCSALTGAQARVFLAGKHYIQLVKICNSGCKCRPAAAQKCRCCQEIKMWDTFADKLFPLLNVCDPTNPANSLNPLLVRLADITETNDTDALEEFYADVTDIGMGWLEEYETIFTDKVTPYVHIVGKHLALLMRESGNAIGIWSQQGFEACHKLIRRIFRSGTTQGGGAMRRSALVQIMQHLFRRNWTEIRASLETTLLSHAGTSLVFDCVAEHFAQVFEEFEVEYHAAFPDRCHKDYIRKEAKRTAKMIRV